MPKISIPAHTINQKKYNTNACRTQGKRFLLYIMIDANSLIQHYALAPHPEGGHYCRSYTSPLHLPASAALGCAGSRPAASAILFLLKSGEYSCLHRLKQDELWHFYYGAPLRVVSISPTGQTHEIIMGHDIFAGHSVQYCLPAGTWFGASPCAGGAFSFIGCTLTPSFHFDDFEMAQRDDLLKRFPHAHKIIHEFTQA